MQLAQLNELALQHIAALLKALGDPMRLRILQVLHRGEASVTDITTAVNGQQPNISKHLQNLAKAGLVQSRKDGLQTLYRVNGKPVDQLCTTICRTFMTLRAQQTRSLQQPRSRSKGHR